MWGKNDGNVTSTQLTTCYEEVVYWKRNLSRVPIGKPGDAFVSELANLFNACATSSSLESIAFYGAMTLPHVLLQRPVGKLKHEEITKHLECRFSLWKNARSIQSCLKSHRSSSNSFDNLARPSPLTKFHPIIFDSITPDLIRSTILQMSGSSGPSGLDASGWKHLSTSFNTFNNLLIAIDQLPRVFSIGIGEVVRRIVGKAVLSVVRDDILEVAGFDPLCPSQPGGCEGAVSVVRSMFQSVECEAVLFADASNAFNLLNRKLVLVNTQKMCPHLATALINCYHLEVPLSIDDEILYSAEGTNHL
uniref:Uncharacterized protein n=1 Tax=Amphimedon queenslandica TaxID=400682 RepID=A0A1X7VS47_AMPQE